MAWRWRTISHAAANRASALWACQNWMLKARPASRMSASFAMTSLRDLRPFTRRSIPIRPCCSIRRRQRKPEVRKAVGRLSAAFRPHGLAVPVSIGCWDRLHTGRGASNIRPQPDFDLSFICEKYVKKIFDKTISIRYDFTRNLGTGSRPGGARRRSLFIQSSSRPVIRGQPCRILPMSFRLSSGLRARRAGRRTCAAASPPGDGPERRRRAIKKVNVRTQQVVGRIARPKQGLRSVEPAKTLGKRTQREGG
jgi:hypothetical protein